MSILIVILLAIEFLGWMSSLGAVAATDAAEGKNLAFVTLAMLFVWPAIWASVLLGLLMREEPPPPEPPAAGGGEA